MVQLKTTTDFANFASDRLSAWCCLDHEARSTVERLAEKRSKFKAGAALWRAETAERALVCILSGWAMRVRDLPDGRRQIYSFLLPGDVAAARVDSDGWRRTVVYAVTPVEAMNISAGCSWSVNCTLSRAAVQAIAQEETHIFDQVVRLGQADGYARAVDLLSELCGRAASARPDHEAAMTLPVTQELFAAALGVTPMHIGRILRRLRAEGAVLEPAGRGGVTIDLDVLGRVKTGLAFAA